MVHARNAVTGRRPGILHGAAGFVTSVCVLVLVLVLCLPRTFLLLVNISFYEFLAFFWLFFAFTSLHSALFSCLDD
jgi:hypothetical protein